MLVVPEGTVDTHVYGVLWTVETPGGTETATLGWVSLAVATKEPHVPQLPLYTGEALVVLFV